MLVNILNALFALTVVAASIGLLAQGARWLGLSAGPVAPTLRRAQRRLVLLESLALDNRRRLVLVRIDEEERALLLSGDRDLELSPLAPPVPPEIAAVEEAPVEDDIIVPFGRRAA